MNCIHCNKPIILVPSAAERARKYGGEPSDYTKLFREHSECLIAHLNTLALELISRAKRG
jgi:hypothetical protein